METTIAQEPTMTLPDEDEMMERIGRFIEALNCYGATDAELVALQDTDLTDCIDEDALAHERLASLRGVPSIR